MSSRLGEPSSPERGHPSPKGEVSRLSYNCNDVPQTLTRSRLGSPERDSTSLKTRVLHLSKSSSVSLGLFLQVSPRRGRCNAFLCSGRVSEEKLRSLLFTVLHHRCTFLSTA
ncbi:hypothetical protein DEO72_LG6g1333 [Vigna unguiculata]|uniref:Uncharacterized protein n=1 Tax=Vigna unguiculata TaxID=3917 RepID=A0A4D6M932_VIGUN|nr:hypothetical protein DEO72_LG6g1333 [Vigna unguiculata]